MKVKDIPANELTTMTPELYQEFAQGGCVPACHLTHDWINIGDKFGLWSADSKTWLGANNDNVYSKPADVMLAEKSTAEDYINYQLRLERERLDAIAQRRAYNSAQGRTGCFRINGQIVP